MSSDTTEKELYKIHNIVVVGDGAVGKTCLLLRFHGNDLPHSYVATIYDKSEFEVLVDDQPHIVQLIDTAGQEEYERLRKVIYPMADAFLLCFSVDDRDSLLNARTKWMDELKEYCKRVPVVLCATKTDLRSANGGGVGNCVTTSEAESVRLKIGANSLVECSAKMNIGVRNAIFEAVRASVMGVPHDEGKRCQWNWICRCFGGGRWCHCNKLRCT